VWLELRFIETRHQDLDLHRPRQRYSEVCVISYAVGIQLAIHFIAHYGRKSALRSRFFDCSNVLSSGPWDLAHGLAAYTWSGGGVLSSAGTYGFIVTYLSILRIAKKTALWLETIPSEPSTETG
jgi:hypothetical protein